ncbi:hypothetical protein Taro_034096 [Colocasia esculenta]|uniref:Uncharacterized protein n=1 Tax=Colocasia esculenta TaxID=4460 RepID=A0A843VVJ9_COLES|nr:hypothetical protein [Colocasia esculenta]
MDFWQRAVVFADGAAKRSKELSMEAAKRSKELTKGASKFSQEFVAETAKKSKELAAETAKKSKELAAEAKKRADEIRVEALKRTDQIKSLARDIPISIPPLAQGSAEAAGRSSSELERFGVTDELREFVEGITISTFRDFPMEDTDEPQIMDAPNASNIRQDLNEWQTQHATLVLSTVKLIHSLLDRHLILDEMKAGVMFPNPIQAAGHVMRDSKEGVEKEEEKAGIHRRRKRKNRNPPGKGGATLL